MFTLITEDGRCGGVIGTQPTHNNWTNIPYNGGLIKEFWNGNEWIESATPEEIAQIKMPIYRKAIYDLVDKLTDSTKERALGKVGDNLTKEQLEKLEVRYTIKRHVAYCIINGIEHKDPVMASLINYEESADYGGEKLLQSIQYINSIYSEENFEQNGVLISIPTNTTRLLMYCNFILAKYELGEYVNKLFTSLIEYFRSKMITWLDNGQFDKIDSGKAIVLSITSNDNVNDIMALKTQFDAL